MEGFFLTIDKRKEIVMSVFTEQEFENYWQKYESNQKKFQERLDHLHKIAMNPVLNAMELRKKEYERRLQC